MGDTSDLVISWRSVMMIMVCLPIVICAILLWFKKYEVSASRALSLLLFLCVLSMVPQIIGFAGFYQVWPGLTFFPFTVDLWVGPLFYLHSYSLIKNEALGWRKWLLAPGIIETAYYSWAFLGLGDYREKWEFSKSFHSPYIDPIESFLAVCFIIFAMLGVWHLAKKYRGYLQDTQSAAIEFQPVWLERMIIALVAGGGIFIGLELIPIFTDVSYFDAFPFQVMLMVILAWLSIEAVWRLNQPFPKQQDVGQPLKATRPIDDRDWKNEGEKIEEAVLVNQWFLEPKLSLSDLATRMASNDVYVSKAINQGLKQSFNEFINLLRVKHAQNLINTTQLPLLTIAFDSGFNSKATFNRVFRDISNTTPSQFKKLNSVNSR